MEKIIILSFILLACVCAQSPSVTTDTATTPDMTSAPAATPSESMPTTTPPPVSTTEPGKTTPTSGAVSVKAFAGLVVSIFLIVLM